MIKSSVAPAVQVKCQIDRMLHCLKKCKYTKLKVSEKVKPVSQLRFDYDTTTTRQRRKIDMLFFCSRLIASNGCRRARYVVVGS